MATTYLTTNEPVAYNIEDAEVAMGVTEAEIDAWVDAGWLTAYIAEDGDTCFIGTELRAAAAKARRPQLEVVKG